MHPFTTLVQRAIDGFSLPYDSAFICRCGVATFVVRQILQHKIVRFCIRGQIETELPARLVVVVGADTPVIEVQAQ